MVTNRNLGIFRKRYEIESSYQQKTISRICAFQKRWNRRPLVTLEGHCRSQVKAESSAFACKSLVLVEGSATAEASYALAQIGAIFSDVPDSITQ